MMYSYPFFSFPHFRRYPNYYSVPRVYAEPSPATISPIVGSKLSARQGYFNHLKESATVRKVDGRSNGRSDDRNNGRNDGKSQVNIRKSQEKEDLKKGTPSFKRAPAGFSFLNNILHQEDRSEDEEYFDLFGVKLYHDDLLLLGLIFFLYKEDVKDQYLFFALILLLLS